MKGTGYFGRTAAALGKLGRFFANMNMQSKMIVIFVFLISLPILVVGLISYQNYARASKTLTVDYVAEIAHNNLSRFEDSVADLYNMSAMPLYEASPLLNAGFMNYLATPDKSFEKLNFMDNYVRYMNKIKPETVSVYAFDKYGNVHYNAKSFGKRIDLDEVKVIWEAAAAAGEGSPRLVSTKAVPPLSGDSTKYAYYAFTVVRELRNLDTRVPVGFIAFDTQLSALDRWLSNTDKLTGGRTTLIDEQGFIVYDTDKSLIATRLDDSFDMSPMTEDRGTFQAEWNGEEHFIIYETSTLTNWKMLVYVPVSAITAQAEKIRDYTSISLVLIVAFALFISIGLTFALTRPLRKMKQLMREVQYGNLNVRFMVRNSDEIGALGTSFNVMISRIEELIEEVKWTQARKKEAELQSLQHQINPHFIYNTLEMIRMTAEAKDDEEIGDMIFRLGKLLRYGVNQGEASVTIEDELEHLRNYLTLQNLRFSDRFRLETDIPGELLRYRCIKLILQPIVENAIYHAFKARRAQGTIRITAQETFEGVLILVADNGAGMDAATLRRLNLRLKSGEPETSGRGIGLANVNERIRLHYGAKYGLVVTSQEDVGTRITLNLPAVHALLDIHPEGGERDHAEPDARR